MATLDELIIRIETDISDLKRGLRDAERTADRSGKRMGRSFRNLDVSLKKIGRSVISLKGALVGLGAGLFTRTVIQNTVRQEQALAAVEAAIRQTGGAAGLTTDELAKMAAEFQRNTAFGDEFVLEVSRQMLSFRNITSDVFEDAISVILDFSSATGRDARQAVRTLGLAINDPLAGLGRLSQAGVALTKSQKDLIKELVQAGDTLGAQRLLIEELEKSYGGAAVAARDTLGGAVDALSNAFGDLFENTENADQLRQSIEGITEAISDPDFQRGFAEVTSNMLAMLSAGADFFAFAARFKQEIRDLFEIPQAGSDLGFVEQMRAISEGLAGEQMRELGPQAPPPPGGGGGGGGDDQAQKALEGIRNQNEELELQLDLIGRSKSEIDSQIALLRLRQQFGEDFAKLAEGDVVLQAALTAEIDRQTKAREEAAAIAAENRRLEEERKQAVKNVGQAIAAETKGLELQLRFLGIESEEFRVQLRMMELKAELGAEAAAAFEDEVRAAEGLRTQLDQIVNAREAQREATERLRSAVDQLGFSFSSAFEDAIINGRSLSDILQGLEEDILRIGLRTLVTEPLFGGIKAGLSGDTLAGEGGLGGLVASGVSAITPGFIKSAFAGPPTDAQIAAVSASADANIAANPEIFGALDEAITTTASGMEGLTGALSAATGGGEAAATALAGELVTGTTEAAAGAAISASASTAAAGGLGEVAVVAAAAAAALSSVAASAGGSTAASSFASLATAGGGLTAAEGGFISGPGSGVSDSIPAMLSDGEFVVNARSASLNRNLLEAINASQSRLAGFVNGGLVGAGAGGGSTISESLQVNIHIGSEVQARDLGPSLGQLRGAVVEAVEIGRARNR